MKNLLRSQDFSWSLFLGHLVIEKLLKAHFVKLKSQHAPFTHDLLRILNKLNLEYSEKHLEWMDEITTFNLNTRYDNYKQDFNKLCTKEFTIIWIERIGIIREWLIKKL